MPSENNWQAMAAATLPSINPRYLHNVIRRLQKHVKYSDLVIKSGSKEWRVHKAIVCIQCTFFANAVKNDWQEAKNATIELHDETEEVVNQLIEFLYNPQYDDTACTTSTTNPCGPLQFNVKVFTAVDKYDIPDLVALAIDKFNCRTKRYNGDPDCFAAVRELYEDAPEAATKMRSIVVEMMVSRFTKLFDQDPDEMTKSKEFRELITEIPPFGTEVVMALSAHMTTQCERFKQLKLDLGKREERLRKDFLSLMRFRCSNCQAVVYVPKVELGSGQPCCPYCARDGAVYEFRPCLEPGTEE